MIYMFDMLWWWHNVKYGVGNTKVELAEVIFFLPTQLANSLLLSWWNANLQVWWLLVWLEKMVKLKPNCKITIIILKPKCKITVMILSFRTDRSSQTMQTQIRLLRSSLIRVYTVCYSVYIFWANSSVVKRFCSNFRIITAIFWVSEF